VRLQDFPALRLVLCASLRQQRARPWMRLARRLGLEGRVHWEFALGQEGLAPWRRHALLSVAPLSECARNLEQGCSPLKVLESMAAGVPVVASDLPSVREILADGEHGRLVAPDRPAELARAIRILLEYPELRRTLGRQARDHLSRHLSWDHATARLRELYRSLGLAGPEPAPPAGATDRTLSLETTA
jgi:glycosyltransferase involved in cell wall biosynthesis